VLKRTFDILASLCGLILSAPLLLGAAAAVRLTSRGPVFFRQQRIGRNFVPFSIVKFRTMVVDAPRLGGPLTQGSRDPRITPVGRFLRRTKIDELPQLWNVLCGEMSLVGPRPEVAKYVEMFRQDYAEILQIRPGITDPASIKYRNEAAELEKGSDPEAEYVGRILPDKIALAKQYLRDSSFWYDLSLLWRTAFSR
jgi:lipopolysaccharide/colanic/teichoic acid biosynthesis glycosyltransferase